MKINKELIKKDIRQAVLPIGIVAALIVLSNLIIGKVCMIRIIFGIPCPTCGITRAFLLLAQGKIKEATTKHPFWIPIIILLAVFLANRYFVSNKKKSAVIIKILKVLSIITVLLCVVYYIYRMITWYPDKVPMLYDPQNIFNSLLDFISKK